MSENKVNLNELKLREEIENLRCSRKEAKQRLYLDGFKNLTIFIGAVIVFLLLRQPESETNRLSSLENLKIERSKMVLTLLESNDVRKKAQGLAAIRAIYGPEGSQWLDKLEKVAYEEEKIRKGREYYERFLLVSKELGRLESEMKFEADTGAVSGNGPGIGPKYVKLMTQYQHELRSLKEILLTLGFKEAELDFLKDKGPA